MILSILKMIGCAILVILLVMILIIVLLLGVPICYQVDGTYYGKADGMVKVRYLPLGITVLVTYRNDTLQYVVRLLGGTIMTNTDAKISWLGRKIFSGYKEASEEENAEERYTEGKVSDRNSFDHTQIQENRVGQMQPKQKEERKSGNKISVFDRIRKGIQKLKKRIRTFFGKCKLLGKKKDALLNVYHSKRFEVAKTDVKRYIGQLFHIIKPYDLEGFIHFGMEDPTMTGEILGGLAWFLPFYQDYLMICPDFESACFEGSIKGKGRIFLGAVLILAIKIMFNKNLIKVTKKVQTIMEA